MLRGGLLGSIVFLVGVAASTVIVALPCYLRDYKMFGKITLLGEILAVAAGAVCLAAIIGDLGHSSQAFDALLHPNPHSILFWCMLLLSGHILLNLAIGCALVSVQRNGAPPPRRLKLLIYITIAWTVCVLTVTVFLHAGFPVRGFLLTAVSAARLLGSAVASGPSLLIVIGIILRKYTAFHVVWEAIQTFAKVVAYALAVSLFFWLWEGFSMFHTAICHHGSGFRGMPQGVQGLGGLALWMWLSTIAAFAAFVLLINPKTRRNETILPIACAATFISAWLG